MVLFFKGDHGMRLIVLIFACSLLFGCAATGYHPAKDHFSGGYTDLKVGPGMHRISFEGNAYITGEKAYQYTLFRAAEITKQNNCDWFEIIDTNEMSRRDFAGFLGYVEKPRNSIVIKLFKEEPPKNAYSADEILKSITIK